MTRMARRASAISLSMRIATLTASTELGLREAEGSSALTTFNFFLAVGILLIFRDPGFVPGKVGVHR